MTDTVTTKCLQRALTEEHANTVNAVVRKLGEQYGAALIIIPAFDLIGRRIASSVSYYDERVTVMGCETIDQLLETLPRAAKQVVEQYEAAQKKFNDALHATKQQDHAIDSLVNFWKAYNQYNAFKANLSELQDAKDPRADGEHLQRIGQDLLKTLLQTEDKAARGINCLIGFTNGVRDKVVGFPT